MIPRIGVGPKRMLVPEQKILTSTASTKTTGRHKAKEGNLPGKYRNQMKIRECRKLFQRKSKRKKEIIYPIKKHPNVGVYHEVCNGDVISSQFPASHLWIKIILICIRYNRKNYKPTASSYKCIWQGGEYKLSSGGLKSKVDNCSTGLKRCSTKDLKQTSKQQSKV